MISKHVEPPIIGICLEWLHTFKTPNNQFETGLNIFHAHRVWLLLKGCEFRFAVLDSIFTLFLHEIKDLLPTEIKIFVIEGIKKPKLWISISFDTDESEPMGSNG